MHEWPLFELEWRYLEEVRLADIDGGLWWKGDGVACLVLNMVEMA